MTINEYNILPADYVHASSVIFKNRIDKYARKVANVDSLGPASLFTVI